jgi:hypothetical protein
MATKLEIIQGLSQALSNKHHGATDPRTGEKIKIGLRREKEIPFTQRGIMDGFSAVFYGGNKMCIKYHTEVLLKEVHGCNFEGEVEQIYANIIKHLQKEYKGHTGRSVSLKPLGESQILMQSISRVRNWVNCVKHYQISGIKGEPNPYKGGEDLIRDATRKFLQLGKNDVAF